MLVVVTTLLTALILLPALLSLLGDRINALRVPFVGKLALRRANGSGGLWERLAHSIMRRPVVWLTVAVVALLVVAAPVVVMKKGNNTASAAHLPSSEYAKQGWDLLDRDFSLGKANPLMIVIDGRVTSPDVKQAVGRLQAAMKADGRFGPAQTTANKTGDLTLLTTTLAGDPAGEATQSLVKHLRSDIVPAAVDGTSAKIYVTGNTAGVVDYLGFFDTWMPVALAVVLGLSFVLLLVVFRSIVVPIKAIVMNLLSVGAAYGLMVAVFQKGWGADLLGLPKVDSVEAWVPLFLFAVLFGISMDYHVFLLSRIRERYDQTGDNRESVAFGLRRTGRHHHGRRPHHGGGLRRDRRRPTGDVPATGLRARGGRAPRRHRGAQHPGAGRHAPAGRRPTGGSRAGSSGCRTWPSRVTRPPRTCPAPPPRPPSSRNFSPPTVARTGAPQWSSRPAVVRDIPDTERTRGGGRPMAPPAPSAS